MDFTNQDLGSYFQRKASDRESLNPNAVSHRTLISTLHQRPGSRQQSPFTMITNPQAVINGFRPFGNETVYSRSDTASSFRALRQRPQSAFVRETKVKKAYGAPKLNEEQKEILKQANINARRKVDYVPLHKILYEMKQNNDEFQEKVQELESSWEGLASSNKLWTFKGERMMDSILEKNSIYAPRKSTTQCSLISEPTSASNVKIPSRRSTAPIRSTRKGSEPKQRLLLLSGKSCASFFREDPLEDFLRKSLREDEEGGSVDTAQNGKENPNLRYNSFLQAYSGPTAASLNEHPSKAGKFSKLEESSIGNESQSVEERTGRESVISLIATNQEKRPSTAVDVRLRTNESPRGGSMREVENLSIAENAEWNYKSGNQSEQDFYPKMPTKAKGKSRPFSSSGALKRVPIHARPSSAMGEIKKVSLSKVLFGLHKESAETIERTPLHVKKMVIEPPMDSHRYLKSGRQGRNKSSGRSLASQSEAFLVVHGQKYSQGEQDSHGKTQGNTFEGSSNSKGFKSWSHELTMSHQKKNMDEVQITNMHTSPDIGKRPGSSDEKSHEKNKNVLTSWVSRDRSFPNFQKPTNLKNKLAF